MHDLDEAAERDSILQSENKMRINKKKFFKQIPNVETNKTEIVCAICQESNSHTAKYCPLNANRITIEKVEDKNKTEPMEKIAEIIEEKLAAFTAAQEQVKCTYCGNKHLVADCRIKKRHEDQAKKVTENEQPRQNVNIT